MDNRERWRNYVGLLEIRQKAYTRNVIIAGGLLLVVMLATSLTLLFTTWNVRSIWLMGIFGVLFVVNFLMSWARLEITRQNIELVHQFELQAGR